MFSTVRTAEENRFLCQLSPSDGGYRETFGALDTVEFQALKMMPNRHGFFFERIAGPLKPMPSQNFPSRQETRIKVNQFVDLRLRCCLFEITFRANKRKRAKNDLG